MNAKTHTAAGTQPISHLAQVVHLYFSTLLCTDIAHQDHLYNACTHIGQLRYNPHSEEDFGRINEQTRSELSIALFSHAHSSLTSRIPTCYTPLVKPIHGLISAFFAVGRLFGTSRPILAWGHGYQSGSFLIWSHYRAAKSYI